MVGTTPDRLAASPFRSSSSSEYAATVSSTGIAVEREEGGEGSVTVAPALTRPVPSRRAAAPSAARRAVGDPRTEGEPAGETDHRVVGRELGAAVRHLGDHRAMALERVPVARGRRARSERGRGPRAERVVRRRPHQAGEGVERKPGLFGQTLHLSEQSDQMIGGHHRGRVIGAATRVVDFDRAVPRAKRQVSGRSGRRRPRRSPPSANAPHRRSAFGSGTSGCSEPRRG